MNEEDLDIGEIQDEITDEIMEVTNKYNKYISNIEITWKEFWEEKQDD